MNSAKKVIIFIIFSVLIVGCHNRSSEYQVSDVEVKIDIPTIEPFNFPKSDSGKSTVNGQLIVLDISMLPSPEDGLFLVPIDDTLVSTIPIIDTEDENVFQATVNEIDGKFVFINIPVGKYAVVVLTQNGAQIPASKLNSSSYVILDINSSDIDRTIELGNITFP